MSPAKNYVIGKITPDQFVPEHTFIYVIKGVMRFYDGDKTYTLQAGDCGFCRKNSLIRYMKEKVDDELEKVFVFFDEVFLKQFQHRHNSAPAKFKSKETVLAIPHYHLINNFIQSLLPYYKGGGIIEAPFTDIKREELLLILLQQQPALAGVFFDYGIPQKINLEEFMNRNYKFNVGIERFAYLTGRSLSAFKRDFKEIFNEAPNHWLVQKRLQEAHFLIEKKKQKPSEIYLELGFETLSHFSYTFKKRFGYNPSDVQVQRQKK